ncbi:MAG TPA: CAP domain-containing protein [Xanthobacteraceae bacterium]|nr:CAP domain-containing protein [Xanthobacteraceae bacterium]
MKILAAALACMLATTLAHADDMAATISRYRIAHGLSAVHMDAQLTAIARRQAEAMASSGNFDHSAAGPFATRIAAANVSSAAENIAMGTKTWTDTFRLWTQSPGHNANLLRSGATRVGVAVAYGGQPRRAYWAMEIGNQDGSSTARARMRPPSKKIEAIPMMKP